VDRAQALNPMYSPTTPRERLAGWFVLVVLGVACLTFWIGIPILILWGLGELTDSGTTHFLGSLLGIPMAMVLFSPALFWLNGLHLRVTGTLRRLQQEEQESGWRRRVRGPLEPVLIACFVVAVAALLAWVLIAKTPPAQFV